MSQPREYFEYWNYNLGIFYLITQKKNQFYLGIWDGAIITYYTQPIRTKSQTFNTFQKFICQVKYQSGKKPNHLQTDFGGEFANQTFEEYIAKEDIKQKVSASYISVQNSKAKRLNYILISLVCSILLAI